MRRDRGAAEVELLNESLFFPQVSSSQVVESKQIVL